MAQLVYRYDNSQPTPGVPDSVNVNSFGSVIFSEGEHPDGWLVDEQWVSAPVAFGASAEEVAAAVLASQLAEATARRYTIPADNVRASNTWA